MIAEFPWTERLMEWAVALLSAWLTIVRRQDRDDLRLKVLEAWAEKSEAAIAEVPAMKAIMERVEAAVIGPGGLDSKIDRLSQDFARADGAHEARLNTLERGGGNGGAR